MSGHSHWAGIKQRKGVNNPNYGKKMSEEQKEKIKLTKSIQRYGDKSFTFENLNGEIKKLFGIELSKFKLEHNLEKSSFCRLLKGELKIYKGWKLIS